MAAFVRRFTDSEGCVNRNGYISIYNTDLQLLTYLKALLHHLGIESTEPEVNVRRGRVLYDHRMGERYITKKDIYQLYIRFPYNNRFYKTVGLTIKRKRRRLEEYYLRRRHSQTSFPPLSHLINLLKIINYTLTIDVPIPLESEEVHGIVACFV